MSHACTASKPCLIQPSLRVTKMLVPFGHGPFFWLAQLRQCGPKIHFSKNIFGQDGVAGRV